MTNESESNRDSEEECANQDTEDESDYQAGFDSFGFNQFTTSPDSTPNHEAPPTAHNTALIYARVSNKVQADEGDSITTQQDANREAAENHDLEVVLEIKDEGKSGQTLNRTGIRKICEAVENDEVDFIIVDHISRLGRTAVETIQLIHEIRVEAGVKLIVSGNVLDITKSRDKMEIITTALLADLETDYQSRKATESLENNFVNNNNWRSGFQLVPFGYVEGDDGWIKRVDELVPVVRTIYKEFSNVTTYEPYAEIRDSINKEYADRLESELDGKQIQSILRRPVYAGRPARGYRTHLGLSEEHCAINKDESLQMIDLKTFRETRQKIQVVDEIHSNTDDKLDAENLAALFGVEDVTDTIDFLSAECADCGEEMVKNGTKDKEDITKQIYLCPNGHSRIVPHVGELKELKGTDDPRKN